MLSFATLSPLIMVALITIDEGREKVICLSWDVDVSQETLDAGCSALSMHGKSFLFYRFNLRPVDLSCLRVLRQSSS